MFLVHTAGFRMSKLDRLKRELEETESLLTSPRVAGTTRYVLERLREDLQSQIAKLESEPTDAASGTAATK